MDRSVQENFGLEQDLYPYRLVRAMEATLPGSAWQSRDQGFESPHLHLNGAGQGPAGSLGCEWEPSVPAPSRVTTIVGEILRAVTRCCRGLPTPLGRTSRPDRDGREPIQPSRTCIVTLTTGLVREYCASRSGIASTER